MGFFSGFGSELKKEPLVILMFIGLIYIIAMPLLSFFLDMWVAFLIITVILVLGWLAVQTVYKDQNKISRGRLNNVP